MIPLSALRGFTFVMLSALTSFAWSAPASYQDIRAMGMGGTGVAAARPAAASFFNPALLASEPDQGGNTWNLMLPGINGRLADRNNLPDRVGEIQDSILSIILSFLANTMDSPETQRNAGRLADHLQALEGEMLRADLAMGASLTRPNSGLGLGLHGSARIRGTVQGNVKGGDIQLLRSIENRNPPTDFFGGDLGSNAHVLATGVIEAGVTLARQFPLGQQQLALGLTPKIMQLHTFNYYETLYDFSAASFNAADYATSQLGANLDAGAVYSFGESQQWRLATSVRNLFPMTLEAKAYPPGSRFFQPQPPRLKIRPLITLGLAHSGERHTLTADLELTENPPFGPEAATRWLSLGGEYRLNDGVALRSGFRQNRASNTGAPGIKETTQASLGLGLSPGRLHLELAATVGDNDIGAGLEVNLRF
ncbi:MAG: hypothetical protein EA349_01265 [Halomonadaceae bacterium]|nr:MAG: hypothetical protein EA349_01265 [Halomonadaceae bacterium]